VGQVVGIIGQHIVVPRGFEFEISIPNLLYILQECNSTKGLDGEFVYAWDGKGITTNSF
jgi:hypothetical protein